MTLRRLATIRYHAAVYSGDRAVWRAGGGQGRRRATASGYRAGERAAVSRVPGHVRAHGNGRHAAVRQLRWGKAPPSSGPRRAAGGPWGAGDRAGRRGMDADRGVRWHRLALVPAAAVAAGAGLRGADAAAGAAGRGLAAALDGDAAGRAADANRDGDYLRAAGDRAMLFRDAAAPGELAEVRSRRRPAGSGDAAGGGHTAAAGHPAGH